MYRCKVISSHYYTYIQFLLIAYLHFSFTFGIFCITGNFMHLHTFIYSIELVIQRINIDRVLCMHNNNDNNDNNNNNNDNNCVILTSPNFNASSVINKKKVKQRDKHCSFYYYILFLFGILYYYYYMSLRFGWL